MLLSNLGGGPAALSRRMLFRKRTLHRHNASDHRGTLEGSPGRSRVVPVHDTTLSLQLNCPRPAQRCSDACTPFTYRPTP
jgi:hypothetical protein